MQFHELQLGCFTKLVSIQNNRNYVSTLSETRCLFRLFRFNNKTTCFGVLTKPKQKKRKPVKIFKIQTKNCQKKSRKIKKEATLCPIWKDFLPWRPLFYSFFFYLFRNWSVCFDSFGCFHTDSKINRRITFLVSRNIAKINRNRLSFGLFRFENWKFVCLFHGHPSFYVTFLLFYRFVSKQIYSFQYFWLFRNGLKILKQIETNHNANF
jgi:hypothetical protein